MGQTTLKEGSREGKNQTPEDIERLLKNLNSQVR